MRRDLHLDISEIAAFGTGPRSEQCDETLRHLLKCRDCRSLLPLPTTKELWRSVLEERGQPQAEDTKETLFSRVASISQLLGRIGSLPRLTRSTAVAAVLFLAIAGFSMLLMFGGVTKTDDRTMAQVGEKLPAPVDSGEIPVRADVEAASNPDSSTESRTEIAKRSKPPSTRQRTASGDRSVVISGTGKTAVPANPGIKSLKRSETRGSGTPCGENSPVGLEISPMGSGLRLNWEKVTGAMSYTVYLSDLDERLIDQYETEKETSYVTAATLEPAKTYKWKLVASVKGGRTTIATSRNFRPIDVKENKGGTSIIRNKKTAARVRCSEDKQ